MSRELEELKKSIVNNPTIKKMAKQTAEKQKTIADAINNSKGIHSLDAFYDTPKIIHKPPVDIDEEEWKEITKDKRTNNKVSGKIRKVSKEQLKAKLEATNNEIKKLLKYDASK